MLISVIVYAVILSDQLTKWWAVHRLQPVSEIPIIRDVLYLKYATNDGMAFGLLSDSRWVFLLLTTVILVAVLIFLYKTRNRAKHPLFAVSLGLILGGGIGNMIDRVFFGDTLFCGSVVDFIDFRLIHFAVFNIADSAVCIGEALLILYILFFDAKAGGKYYSFAEKEKKAAEDKHDVG